MLRFEAYRDGKPVKSIELAGAYLFGADGIPLRADIATEGNVVTCVKRAPSAAGLAILWPAGTSGAYLLPTSRLPERRAPYNLNVELARGQFMRIMRKREEWGLFDDATQQDLTDQFEHARQKFVHALAENIHDPASASTLADEALELGMAAGEAMALRQADLTGRKRIRDGVDVEFGVGLDSRTDPDGAADLLADELDFISIPTPWKVIESAERVLDFSQTDTWINFAAREELSVQAGPLICFERGFLPDWMDVWKGDFEALRRMVLLQVTRVVERYRDSVSTWIAASGLNAENSCDLSFDQILELTRATLATVKRIAPNSTAVLEITQPWGEYYARNMRTIPPGQFADLVFQNDLKFDAFGLQLPMGIPGDGTFVRDLLQTSMLLEELLPSGRPVLVTRMQCPSSEAPDKLDAYAGRRPIQMAGRWRDGWTPTRQAQWLEAVSRIALSKPAVDGLCWGRLSDVSGQRIPHGGLCRRDLKPKPAFQAFLNLRGEVRSKQWTTGSLEQKPDAETTNAAKAETDKS